MALTGLRRSAFSLSRLWTRLTFFFQLDSHIFFDSNFKILTRVCSHDISLVFFFRSWTYILQISTHIFYCIRRILQVATYVLCFQHVFTIGIILSATERHTHGRKMIKPLQLITCFMVSSGRRLVRKAGNHQSWKQWCCRLCWKLPDRAQSFVFCSQIVTE